jgi:hypothetical protein
MLTDIEEKYCLLVCATGSYSKAFRRVWPDADPNGHLEMAGREDIANRVAQLTIVRNQLPVTLQDHAERIAVIRDSAMDKEDYSTALKAETKLGELRGFYIKKVEVEEKQYRIVQLPPALKDITDWEKLVNKQSVVERPAITVKAERVE